MSSLKNFQSPNKRTIRKSDYVRERIIAKLGEFPKDCFTPHPDADDRYDQKFVLHMADTKYCLPPLKLAEKIINKSRVDERVWDLYGAFDCDDFALVLKANFAQAAYKRGEAGAFCFGIVWGMLPYPFPHALNWMINDDMELRFVEPRTDRIFNSSESKVQERFKYIHLMLV